MSFFANIKVRLPAYLDKLVRNDVMGGVLMLFCTLLALVLQNGSYSTSYRHWLEMQAGVVFGDFQMIKPLLLWINDGLITIFFFSIGLELKTEFIKGHLADRRNILLPCLGAIAGILVPSLFFTAFNYQDPYAMRGWAIPTSTDTAFSVAIVLLLGNRVPFTLRIFLLSMAIFDDIGAILVLAIFYTSELSEVALIGASFAIFCLYLLNYFGAGRKLLYLLFGVILWFSIFKSGMHATLAGIITAFFIPMKSASGEIMVERIYEDLKMWVSFFVLPLFTLANAGVDLSMIDIDGFLCNVSVGIFLALFLGKQLGIFFTVYLCIKCKLVAPPPDANFKQIYGVCILTGIGFSMSMFFDSLAYQGSSMYNYADTLAILVASLCSGIYGYCFLRFYACRTIKIAYRPWLPSPSGYKGTASTAELYIPTGAYSVAPTALAIAEANARAAAVAKAAAAAEEAAAAAAAAAEAAQKIVEEEESDSQAVAQVQLAAAQAAAAAANAVVSSSTLTVDSDQDSNEVSSVVLETAAAAADIVAELAEAVEAEGAELAEVEQVSAQEGATNNEEIESDGGEACAQAAIVVESQLPEVDEATIESEFTVVSGDTDDATEEQKASKPIPLAVENVADVAERAEIDSKVLATVAVESMAEPNTTSVIGDNVSASVTVAKVEAAEMENEAGKVEIANLDANTSVMAQSVSESKSTELSSASVMSEVQELSPLSVDSMQVITGAKDGSGVGTVNMANGKVTATAMDKTITLNEAMRDLALHADAVKATLETEESSVVVPDTFAKEAKSVDSQGGTVTTATETAVSSVEFDAEIASASEASSADALAASAALDAEPVLDAKAEKAREKEEKKAAKAAKKAERAKEKAAKAKYSDEDFAAEYFKKVVQLAQAEVLEPHLKHEINTKEATFRDQPAASLNEMAQAVKNAEVSAVASEAAKAVMQSSDVAARTKVKAEITAKLDLALSAAAVQAVEKYQERRENTAVKIAPTVSALDANSVIAAETSDNENSSISEVIPTEDGASADASALNTQVTSATAVTSASTEATAEIPVNGELDESIEDNSLELVVAETVIEAHVNAESEAEEEAKTDAAAKAAEVMAMAEQIAVELAAKAASLAQAKLEKAVNFVISHDEALQISHEVSRQLAIRGKSIETVIPTVAAMNKELDATKMHQGLMPITVDQLNISYSIDRDLAADITDMLDSPSETAKVREELESKLIAKAKEQVNAKVKEEAEIQSKSDTQIQAEAQVQIAEQSSTATEQEFQVLREAAQINESLTADKKQEEESSSAWHKLASVLKKHKD